MKGNLKLTRRQTLQILGTQAGAAVASSFFSRGAAHAARAKPFLVPVKVARPLIARTIVGLRPFRPAGFVVRGEKLGEKTLVHNYGHGGCGITLSWGTAQLAVDEIAQTGENNIAVLGAGAVGLATARLLQQRGLAVTIYARDVPPNTTSDIAGGRWYPFDVFDSNAIAPDFMGRLWSASRVSYKIFTELDPQKYGIRRRRTFLCRNSPVPPTSLLNFDSPIHEMLPGMRDLQPKEHPFPYPIVRTFETLMIEPAIYLPAIVADFKAAGGTIVQKELKTLADVAALLEKAIVNCTGLGAGVLFSDTTLLPIKGQLTILKPQPAVDYVILPRDGYMFPRTDGIVLGGTFVRNDWTLAVDPIAEARIFEEHRKFFASLKRL